MANAIPLIDKIDGKERVVTSIVLPRDALQRIGLTGEEKLRAVTVFYDDEIEGMKAGDIVVVNTEDKDIRGKGTFVLDNHDRTAIGEVQAVPGSHDKMMLVKIGGNDFEVPVGRLPIVGRVVSSVLVGRPH